MSGNDVFGKKAQERCRIISQTIEVCIYMYYNVYIEYHIELVKQEYRILASSQATSTSSSSTKKKVVVVCIVVVLVLVISISIGTTRVLASMYV